MTYEILSWSFPQSDLLSFEVKYRILHSDGAIEGPLTKQFSNWDADKTLTQTYQDVLELIQQ